MLAEGVLPQTAPGHATGTYWLVGVIGSLLLICSLLAHELAHAIVARSTGVEVGGLTLWMLGGVATLHGEASTPREDFRIAAAGPATSLALSGLFGVVWLVLAATDQPDLLVSVTGWLAGINLVLAVFNLLPGAPLDGGRILRAALWKHSGDRYRAAAAATTTGQVVAFGLVALGLLSLMAGDSVGGLWMLLVGWFLLVAARAEQASGTAQHVLHGVLVGEVMSTPVQTVHGDLSVAQLIEQHVLSGRHSAYPVVDVHGTVVGLITLDQLRHVPPARRATTAVRDVSLPLDRVAVAQPRDALTELLTRVTRESGGRALVLDHERLVGIVSPADVTRALEGRALLPATER